MGDIQRSEEGRVKRENFKIKGYTMTRDILCNIDTIIHESDIRIIPNMPIVSVLLTPPRFIEGQLAKCIQSMVSYTELTLF